MVTSFGYGVGEFTCPGVVGFPFNYSGQYLLPDVPAQQKIINDFSNLINFGPSLPLKHLLIREVTAAKTVISACA
jgi:hypothetical protein